MEIKAGNANYLIFTIMVPKENPVFYLRKYSDFLGNRVYSQTLPP
jgi:hypothetical protein